MRKPPAGRTRPAKPAPRRAAEEAGTPRAIVKMVQGKPVSLPAIRCLEDRTAESDGCATPAGADGGRSAGRANHRRDPLRRPA